MAEGGKRLRGSFRRLDKTLALLTAAAVLFGCLIQYSEYRAGFVTRRALLTPDGAQMVCMNQRSNSVTILPVGPDGVPGMPTRVLPFMHPSDVAFVEA